MNKFVTLLFTYISYVFAQTCLVDGLALTYTGLTETVNGEQLFLFRCVAEHQMWLSELQKTQSHYIAIVDETKSPSNENPRTIEPAADIWNPATSAAPPLAPVILTPDTLNWNP